MDEKKKQVEMPGPEKTGSFIKLLRTSHNFTQEELGDLVYVTRKAVSKWENGICYPSIDLIPRLADLFGVSLEEILAGEFNCEENSNANTIDYVIKVFKDRRLKTIIRSFIVLFVFCLILFFFENYNATKIYDVYFEDGNIYLKNSAIISTRSKQYFNFGSVWIDDTRLLQNKPINLELYMKEKNKEKKIMASYSTNNVVYYRNPNYKELSIPNINEITNSLWINIKYYVNNGEVVEKDIPLLIELRYKSNDIVQLKEKRDIYKLETNYTPFIGEIHVYERNTHLSSPIDISKICNILEKNKESKLNTHNNVITIKYMNRMLTVLNKQIQVLINFRDNTFHIVDIQNNGRIIANGSIKICKLHIENVRVSDQSDIYINKARELLSKLK